MGIIGRCRERGNPSHLQMNDKAGTLAFGTIIFVCITILSLREPSLAMGQAIGLNNFIIVVASSLGAVIVSCLGLRFLIDLRRWTPKVSAVFFTAAMVMSGALNDIFLRALDSRFELGQSVAEAKVVFHCKARFNPGLCVGQLSICPQCKNALSVKERQELQARLIVFADEMDEQFQRAEAARGQSGPLSEAAQDWRKRQNQAPIGNLRIQ